MKSLFITLLLLLIPTLSFAENEFWTVNNIRGVNTFSTGTVYILMDTATTPYSPSPETLTWTACRGNALYISHDENNTPTNPKYLDRMLASALVAYSKKSKLRINFFRDSDNRCYLKTFYHL